MAVVKADGKVACLPDPKYEPDALCTTRANGEKPTCSTGRVNAA